jgi:hypothetical protein
VSRTTLDSKMSKFVTARLGLDGVQCEHKGLYWFRQECSYIQWILLLLMLPYTGVLIVGVTSFREKEQIPSLWWRMSLCFWLVRYILEQESVSPPRVPLDVAPTSPFLVPRRGLWLHLW